MVDMTMFTGAMSALKAAGEITKLIVATHDADVIREKVRELNTQILAAQQHALTAQSEHFALLDYVRDLEKELTDLKAWDAEKQRYELEEVTPGSFAYAVRPAMQGAEPQHKICATCYQKGRKFILQRVPANNVRTGMGMPPMLRCPECKTDVIMR